jgi:GNAT superfamily N-acetyltransferase
MPIQFSDARLPSIEQALALYKSLSWSSAEKPEALIGAMRGSHALITAWDEDALVGLGNAISDGHLVVYFPHLLVRPDHQGRGIGSELTRMLLLKYAGFHQQVLLADGRAAQFYERLGFSRGGSTVPMWIYDGHDHD